MCFQCILENHYSIKLEYYYETIYEIQDYEVFSLRKVNQFLSIFNKRNYILIFKEN